jgi:hypothetical protein
LILGKVKPSISGNSDKIAFPLRQRKAMPVWKTLQKFTSYLNMLFFSDSPHSQARPPVVYVEAIAFS